MSDSLVTLSPNRDVGNPKVSFVDGKFGKSSSSLSALNDDQGTYDIHMSNSVHVSSITNRVEKPNRVNGQPNLGKTSPIASAPGRQRPTTSKADKSTPHTWAQNLRGTNPNRPSKVESSTFSKIISSASGKVSFTLDRILE
ncbi:hypothetical protein Cni_G06602 [Canna indica]|uniref:Uncharacterized protein n=1 Tax=Canna indica TaxID=4628 RepID=A0AAQ3JWW9_9LILI|nr:hypothetical protein Cni_G06602 [Canna indica]